MGAIDWDHMQSAEMWLEAFEGTEDRTPEPFEALLAAICHALLAIAEELDNGHG